MFTILRWLQASGKAHEDAAAEVRGILEAQGGREWKQPPWGVLSGAAAGSADSIDTQQDQDTGFPQTDP